MREIASYQQAIKESDEAHCFHESYAYRMELVELAALNGKDELAIEPLMWCLQAYDQFSDQLKPKPLLWRYKWVLNSMCSSADVTADVVHAMYADLEKRLINAGYSARSVYRIRAGHAMSCGDHRDADEFIQAYRACDRDELSDCEACELSDRVKYLKSVGLVDEALETATPLIEGELGCGSLPEGIYADLLWCLFDQGNYELIRQNFSFWYASISDDLDSVEDISDYLLWLVIEKRFDLACGFVERYSGAILGSALDNGRYCFARSCAALFQRMDAKRIRLELPARVTAANDNGTYDSRELAEFYSGIALEIAGRYDQRNGNTFFRDEFEKWTRLDFGQRAYPVVTLEPQELKMAPPVQLPANSGLFDPSLN